MKNSTKKKIRDQINEMDYRELVEHAKKKQEWLDKVLPKMNMICGAEGCGAAIRNWVRIEIACYELETVYSRLGRTAKFNKKRCSSELLDEDSIF